MAAGERSPALCRGPVLREVPPVGIALRAQLRLQPFQLRFRLKPRTALRRAFAVLDGLQLAELLRQLRDLRPQFRRFV